MDKRENSEKWIARSAFGRKTNRSFVKSKLMVANCWSRLLEILDMENQKAKTLTIKMEPENEVELIDAIE